MKLIKRNGAEVNFDREKIYAAIMKANAAVEESERIAEECAREITDRVVDRCEKLWRSVIFSGASMQASILSKSQPAG